MQREETLLGLLKRLCLESPLFLPLLAVVGALLGGQWWGLTVVTLLLAHTARLWRQLLCALLCTSIAVLQADMQQRSRDELNRRLQSDGYVYLEGTVERTLSRGCILDTGLNGARVALRGKIPGSTGDRIAVYAEPRDLRPAPVKGMFDNATWQRSQGLAADLRVQSAEYLGMSCSLHALRGLAESVREYLLSNLMPPGTEGDWRRQVLCSLALGDKSGADAEVTNTFKRGGCLHAFAVSGMHVGIVSGLLYLLGAWLRLRARTLMLLVMIVAGLYVLVTGLAVPAMRAYVMVVLVLLGRWIGRRACMLNIWSLTALVLLLIEPWQLRNAGFVLSFAVYAGIGLGVRICMNESPWLHPDPYLPLRFYAPRHDRLCRFDYILRGTVVVSLSAWLISLPITALFFHTVTPYSFLTNLAIAPLLAPTMGAGLLAAVAGGIPWLGPALEWCALKCSSVLLAVVGFFGSMPMAYLPLTDPAEPATTMVCSTGYGESFVLLGNPGLVINMSSPATTRFNTEPALFFSGCQPAALLQSGSLREQAAAAQVLQFSWPQLHVVKPAEHLNSSQVFTTPAGIFTIYPPSGEPSVMLEKNAAPVVLWQRSDGSRVLCVGPATVLTYNRLSPEERRADVLIYGYNEDLAPELPAVLSDTGASLCILLPDVPSSVREAVNGEACRIVQVGDDLPLFCLPEPTESSDVP